MITIGWKTTTGIYVGARDVYLVQIKKTLFGPRLVKFAKTQIKTEPNVEESLRTEAIVQALRKLIRDNRIAAKQVSTALIGKDVVIRYFQMARIPKGEWETAVKFEAKKYLPFKIEELMWDFHVVLPKDKEDKMDVTFAGIRREGAQKYLNLFRELGLKPVALEPAPFSLVRLFTLSKQLSKDKSTAIVNVDYGTGDINIVRNRSCYLTRDLSLPSEKEVLFDQLLNEIRMTFDYYEKLFPTEVIGKILLCGQVQFEGWDRKLAQELNVAVEKADLARALKSKRKVPALDMAVVIGLGLQGIVRTAAEVNLCLAHEVKTKLKIAKQALEFTPQVRKAILRGLILSCLGLSMLYLSLARLIAREQKKLEDVIFARPVVSTTLQALSYPELEAKEKELRYRLSTLSQVVDKRIFLTHKFNQLPKLLPPGVWLTELTFNDSLPSDRAARQLIIKGVARHQDPVEQVGMVTKLVSDLREDQLFFQGFSEIKLSAMTSTELEGELMKTFAITCIQ